MFFNQDNQTTHLNDADLSKLIKITSHLIHHVSMPEPGLYSTLSKDDIWLGLVLEFCVLNGRRLTDELKTDTIKFYEFREKINYRFLLSLKNNRKEYLAHVLKTYKATSFYNKQAERLEEVFNSPKVVKGNQLVLLQGIDHRLQHFNEIRDTLISRIPHFKLKSASDFMIENGLSLDVMAINSRIADVLNQHFGLEVSSHKIHSNKTVYESIESCLRKACDNIGIPLAYLSRMLDTYTEKDTISYLLEDN